MHKVQDDMTSTVYQPDLIDYKLHTINDISSQLDQ